MGKRECLWKRSIGGGLATAYFGNHFKKSKQKLRHIASIGSHRIAAAARHGVKKPDRRGADE
jgi:hypothetical protein